MSDRPATDSTTAPRRGVWPHVRAALVAAHILAVIVLAIPDAGGVALNRASWKNPTVQAELRGWAERLSSLGIQTDAPRLEQRVYETARSWTETLAAIRRPLRPYVDIVGVRQTWRMFVAPHRHPGRLHVDIQRDGRWESIQIARSDEHDWRGAQLDHVRARAMVFRYGWKRYRRRYHRLTRWIAARAAEDFPEASHVRVRLHRFRTPTPHEVLTDSVPPGRFDQSVVLALEEFR